ncbi:GTP cyclohydrolase [Hyphodiscus hymeniophilus]|uniref:ATP phosphoribosyltransferase n=1 Tax=Hyphodiscus hymeniophilus TaxID=353542 RepID=A0A9P7AZ19_9HELO|nr:GTP cyclohydrolase [Hyphodiscus hymeniophilus]
MSPSATTRYKLVYTVLPAYLQTTKDAIFAAGGGIYAQGKYIQVAYETYGSGQFLPVSEAGAVPHTGTPGTLEKVEEVRVEITCTGADVTRAAVAALKKAHPFEEVGYEVFKIEDF